MSKLSDALARMNQQSSAPPPKPKPKPAPKKAAPPKPSENWLDRFIGEPDPTAPAAQGLSPEAKKLGDAIAGSKLGRVAGSAFQKIGNVAESPLTLIGATIEDNTRKRGGPGNVGPAARDALGLMLHGEFGKAAQRYSTTSPYANRIRASEGDTGAQYLEQHPKQFAALAGLEELPNPGNLGLGRLAGLAGRAGKGLAGLGERAATAGARAAGSANPTENIFSRAARGMQGGGGRFGEVNTAAERTNPQQAQAAHAAATHRGTNIANAKQYAEVEAQRQVADQFKGMSPEEKREYVDRMENAETHGPFKTFDDAGEQRINRALQMQITHNIQNDAQLLNLGIAEKGQLRDPHTFVPRRGFSADPYDSAEQYPGEDDLDVEDWAQQHRSGSGVGVRKGTLVKHRKYDTLREAVQNGVELNPDWDPAKAELERRSNQIRSMRIEHELQQLQKEAPGLIQPKTLETADGKTIELPRPPGTVEFTEAGDTRTYGSPTLRNSYVDPSVQSLIADITPNAKIEGVSGVGPVASKVAQLANRAALGLYTGNLLFHGGVNLPGNALRELFINRTVDPKEFAQTLFSKEGNVAEAERAGATVSRPSRLPLETLTGRTQDIKSPMERAGARLEQFLESINSGPLFRDIQLGNFKTPGIEPRLASATYRGALAKNLKAGMSQQEARARAVDIARGIVGEHEKVPKWLNEAAGTAVPFLSWRRSQLMRWLPTLAKHPEVFQAIHRGVGAYNASRGRGERPTDANTFIPPIEWNKGGGTTTIANPADWTIGLLDAAASGDIGKLGQKAIYDITPLASATARVGATMMRPQVQPNTPLDRALGYLSLWDTRNPDVNAPDVAKGIISKEVQSYSPMRQLTPQGLLGISNTPDAKQGKVKIKTSTGKTISGYPNLLEKDLLTGYPYAHDPAVKLGGIEGMEKREARNRAKGDTKRADRDHAAAVRLYKMLLEVEQQTEQP